MSKRGFTIIEVLVTLVILSMIAVVSANILQSSLISEKESSQRLNLITELNIASSTLRRDIRQIANVPMKDFYGDRLNATFISELNSENFMFTTKVKSYSNEVSPFKRVQYLIEDNKFIRDDAIGEISIRDLEKEAIIRTLRFFNTNRRKTAKSLGMSERTLYRKIDEYGLETKIKKSPK